MFHAVDDGEIWTRDIEGPKITYLLSINMRDMVVSESDVEGRTFLLVFLSRYVSGIRN